MSGGGNDRGEERDQRGANDDGELMRCAIEALPNVVAYLDADVRVRFCNRAALAWLEKPREDVLGRTLHELIGSDRFAAVEVHVRAALAGEPQSFERTIVRAVRPATVQIQYTPHVVGGIVRGLVLNLIDVTRRKESERLIEVANENLGFRVRARTEELRASEDRFAKAFRSGPAALVIRRISDGRCVEVNDAFVRVTGLTREEIIGRTPLEAADESEATIRERAARLNKARAADGSVSNVELQFVTKSMGLRTALVSIEPITFGEHGPCTLGTFIDITERKLAERRLGLQHAVSRALASAASLADAAPLIIQEVCESEGWDIGAIWKDDQGRGELRCINAWNRPALDSSDLAKATRSLTFARGQGLPGRVWASGKAVVIADVAKDSNLLRAEAASAVGLSCAMAFPILHAGNVLGVIDFIGGPRATDPQLEVLLEAIGRQIGLFVARSRAAATLKRSEERLQMIIENLHEGLILATLEGEMVHWNSAALRMHGFDHPEDGWLSFAARLRRFELFTVDGAVVPPADWPLRRVARGEVVRDMELRIVRTGTDWSRAFSYSGAMVVQPDGTQLVSLMMTDITDRLRREDERRRNEELAEDNRRMREESRLKSEFLANMSHELRTPLNAIIGFSGLLHAGKAGALSPTQVEYLGDILTSSRHLLQLINDVLDLAKVEAGKLEVRVEEVNLSKVVSEVGHILRGLAAEKKIKIKQNISAKLVHVHVDARMFKQMLYNYLSNAIKFTPDGGHVELRIVPEGMHEFRLDVQDSGVGIRGEDMPKLFHEFQQLDSGLAKHYPGTGLGLALTKRIVEAQGGNVSVISVRGQGSTFSAVLPRVVSAPTTQERA